MRECAILYKKKLHECKNTSIPPKFSITIRLHWIWNSRQICSFILIVWLLSLSLCHCGNPFICLFFTYAPSSKTYLYYLSKRKRKFTIEWVQKHLSRMIKILFVEIQLSTKCLFGVQLLASNMRAMLLHATGFTNNLMKTVNTEGYMNLIRM